MGEKGVNMKEFCANRNQEIYCSIQPISFRYDGTNPSVDTVLVIHSVTRISGTLQQCLRTVQGVKGTKHEKLEKALAIWIEQLNVKNGVAAEGRR